MPEMNIPRLKGGDLQLVGQMGWQQHYEARTVYPVVLCLGIKGNKFPQICENQNFFMDVRSNCRTGDRINLCRYSQNNGWGSNAYQGHVIEVIEGLRVLHSDSAGVMIMATTPPWIADIPGEDGVVVARGFGQGFVIRLNGDVSATRQTVVEANEYATMLAAQTGKPLKLFDGNKKAA